MKIEKISENKVKITLTIDELSERKITLKDIEKNHIKAQDLFIDLIEESNLQEEFINENTELFVEATSDNSNFFMITITKVDYLKALPSYNLLKSGKGSASKISIKDLSRLEQTSPNSLDKDIRSTSNSKLKISHAIKSYIYKFECLEYLTQFCKKAVSENLFIGNNSIYKNSNDYFLVFKNSTIKNPEFANTFRLLSEYCSSYYSSALAKCLINEKASVLLEKKAIEYLSEF